MKTEALWIALVGVVIVIVIVIRFAVRAGWLGSAHRRSGHHWRPSTRRTWRRRRCGPASTRARLERAIPHLRELIGIAGVAIADTFGILAAEGRTCTLRAGAGAGAGGDLERAAPGPVPSTTWRCEFAGTCSLQGGVIVPITMDDVVVGAIVAADSCAPASLLRLSGGVAEFVSTQLQLAELDRGGGRTRRSCVSGGADFPHFIYNALTAIESFVRSDPDRARELLVQFGQFIRYRFRSQGQFVTMAEEIRLVDTYLDLERARFGDRLEVTLRVAPEVLRVMLPPFVLQPLVENAVHHGLEPSGEPGHLEITIMDADDEPRSR